LLIFNNLCSVFEDTTIYFYIYILNCQIFVVVLYCHLRQTK
jgi:hypothetical protein